MSFFSKSPTVFCSIASDPGKTVQYSIVTVTSRRKIVVVVVVVSVFRGHVSVAQFELDENNN